MNLVDAVWHSAAFHTILTGAITGAGVDIHTFLSWKSINDAAGYRVSTLLLHVAQGIALSLLTLGGLTLAGA